MYLFTFLTLYMFRAHRAHHQERQIVSVQPLVAVTVCRITYLKWNVILDYLQVSTVHSYSHSLLLSE